MSGAPLAAQTAFRPVLPNRLRLRLRTRVQPWKGVDAWVEHAFAEDIPAAELAILICDMWDTHTCAAAARRVDAMAPRMNAVVSAARAAGVQIIHSPSDVLDFYADTPQRRRVLAVPPAPPPQPLELPNPPLPIDDSDGGCDSPGPRRTGPPWPWTRQHAAIEIAEPDLISVRGDEVYSLLRHLGIGTLVIMGVHTNMCVLHRTFGIKAMTRWGVRCILARDLTDALYNPAKPPYVSHDEGTELVVQHIERHWCPSVLGEDLARVVPGDSR
jgi:nicotinamidase-related amidase